MDREIYENKSYDYIRFPRQFVSYKWYKPLLTALLTLAFGFGFMIVVFLLGFMVSGNINFLAFLLTISADVSSMDMYTLSGALVSWGAIASLLPALALSNYITGDRPFSSMSSSRGGWNWSAFFKCLGLAALIMGVPMLLQSILFPMGEATHVIMFTVPGAIAATLLLPIQCMAEEYLFRGFLMQTFGSWFRLPWLAIILQAAVFTSLHVYDIYGLAAIAIMGIAMGIITWLSKGIEASGACHIVNNMAVLYITGLGIETGSDSSLGSLILTSVIDITYAVLVIFIGKKRGWFSEKEDTVEKFNEKKLSQKRFEARMLREKQERAAHINDRNDFYEDNNQGY